MNKQSTVMTNATASNREVWREGLRNELRSENRESRTESGRRKWHNLKLRKCMRNKKVKTQQSLKAQRSVLRVKRSVNQPVAN